MNITVRTTQRHFDMKDLTELEMTALYSLLNWNDTVLEQKVMEQKSDWEGNWLDEEVVKSAIEMRDKIFKALEEE